MTANRPLTGRIIPPGEPLGADPEPIDHQVVGDAPSETPAPAEWSAPPEVTHVHVYVTTGADLSPVEADDGRPWWMPAYTLRTAIVGALGLMPLPSIGAPAAQWALFVGDATAEQSLGAGWTIAGAAIVGAFAIDRGSRWDRELRQWRAPSWLARGLLCAAISGAALALPIADGLVTFLTGEQPS